MSESARPDAGALPKKKVSRGLEYALIAVILGLIVAAAWFQESVLAFVKLRLWDRDAAGRTVVAFLEAGKKGDQAAAGKLMGADAYKPLTENGKWTGYFIVSQAGRMDIPFTDLLPSGEVKPARTEFVTIGKGAAEVFVPNATGQPVKYRLEMQGNGWKITEIDGGHPAQQPAGGRGAAPPGGKRR